MQDYISLAEKNGVTLKATGPCQFCGANTTRGVHECMDIFNLGFKEIDFNRAENHIFRFLIVDAHTLQHPEIHGRWSNHFHLTRLHLIFHHGIAWRYELSPILSDRLNRFKRENPDEVLSPPPALMRGKISSTDLSDSGADLSELKKMIEDWARKVYEAWGDNLSAIEPIAKRFLNEIS